MNSKLYRCGWCGCPTDANGEPLQRYFFDKATRLIETYGDAHTHLVNGECCAYDVAQELEMEDRLYEH